MLGKKLLGLDRLPVLGAPVGGQDGELADTGLLLKLFDLADDFVRSTDESDLLVDDLVVRNFGDSYLILYRESLQD